MNKTQGTLLAIEGDNTVVVSQIDSFASALEEQGRKVAIIRCPSHVSKSYANPYKSAIVAANELAKLNTKITELVSQRYIVIVLNYVGHIMEQHATGFASAHERRGFYVWIDNLAHVLLEVARPTITLILRADSNQLYDEINALFPKDHKIIDTLRNNNKVEQSDIKKIVLNAIDPYLPAANKDLDNYKRVIIDGNSNNNQLGDYNNFIEFSHLSKNKLNFTTPNTISDDLKQTLHQANQQLEAAFRQIVTKLDVNNKFRIAAMVLPTATAPFSSVINNPNHPDMSVSDELLPNNYTQSTDENISLINYTPRNELDLAAPIAYEFSDKPFVEVLKASNQWNYEEKSKLLINYVKNGNTAALQDATYTFDLVSDVATFYELKAMGLHSSLQHQHITPRLGFETPEELEEQGLTDLYEQCFDVSFKLHSALVAQGYAHEAQYATLLGHKMRWRVTYSAKDIFKLNEHEAKEPVNADYTSLAKELRTKMGEVHPIIGSSLKC